MEKIYYANISSSLVQSQTDSNDLMSAVTLSAARDKQSMCTSMIAPVWVSTKQNLMCEKLVYALFDSQSDTTFIDKGVSESRKVSSKVEAYHYAWERQSERVSGLQVRAYKSDTRVCIPVNHSHIPTSGNLPGIRVILLIGYIH